MLRESSICFFCANSSSLVRTCNAVIMIEILHQMAFILSRNNYSIPFLAFAFFLSLRNAISFGPKCLSSLQRSTSVFISTWP